MEASRPSTSVSSDPFWCYRPLSHIFGHTEASSHKEGRGGQRTEEEKEEGDRKSERCSRVGRGSSWGPHKHFSGHLILEWSAPAGTGLPLISSLISTLTRHACSLFTLQLGKIELREEICKVHSADPHQSLCVCFLLSGSASTLHPWSGAHSHDPAPRQAEPLPSPGKHLARFQAPDLSWKARLTAGATGTSQGERARPASSEEGRAEAEASKRQGLGVPSIQEVTSLRRDAVAWWSLSQRHQP